MCCSVSPDVKVKFSDTILYGAEVLQLSGKAVHTIGYQNIAQNDVSGAFGTGLNRLVRVLGDLNPFGTSKANGNAMILPFPALPKTMTSANVLDTKACPGILDDIQNAVRIAVATPATTALDAAVQSPPKIQVFDAAGIYTVVLAQDARDIPDALKLVPEKKRPQLNRELFDDYARWYSAWTFALCCFNNTEARRALPLLWWYEPMFPDELFLPTLDSHDGSSPELNAEVLVDHSLAVGTYRPDHEEQSKQINYPRHFLPVEYKDQIPAQLKPYLMDKVIGRSYYEKMNNGDMVCKLEAVRKGTFEPLRRPPPGA